MSKNVNRCENASARPLTSVANPVGKVRPIMTPLGNGQVTMVTKAHPRYEPDMNPGPSRIIRPSGGPWIVRPYLPPRNSIDPSALQQHSEESFQSVSSFQIPSSENIPPNTLLVPSIYAMYPNVPSVRPLRWVTPQQTPYTKEMVQLEAVKKKVVPQQQQQAASNVVPVLPNKEQSQGNQLKTETSAKASSRETKKSLKATVARQRNLITQLVKIIVNEKLAKLPDCEIMLQGSKRNEEAECPENDSGTRNDSAETQSSSKANTIDESWKETSKNSHCSKGTSSSEILNQTDGHTELEQLEASVLSELARNSPLTAAHNDTLEPSASRSLKKKQHVLKLNTKKRRRSKASPSDSKDSRKLKRERRRSSENRAGSPVFNKSVESSQQEVVCCQKYNIEERDQVIENSKDEKNVNNVSSDSELTLLHRRTRESVMHKQINADEPEAKLDQGTDQEVVAENYQLKKQQHSVQVEKEDTADEKETRRDFSEDQIKQEILEDEEEVEDENICEESDGEVKADDDWRPAPIYSCYMSTSSQGSDGGSGDQECSMKKRSVEKKRKNARRKRCRLTIRNCSTTIYGRRCRRSPRKRPRPPQNDSFIRRSASKQASKRISNLLTNDSSEEFSASSPERNTKLNPSSNHKASLGSQKVESTSEALADPGKCVKGITGKVKTREKNLERYDSSDVTENRKIHNSNGRQNISKDSLGMAYNTDTASCSTEDYTSILRSVKAVNNIPSVRKNFSSSTTKEVSATSFYSCRDGSNIIQSSLSYLDPSKNITSANNKTNSSKAYTNSPSTSHHDASSTIQSSLKRHSSFQEASNIPHSNNIISSTNDLGTTTTKCVTLPTSYLDPSFIPSSLKCPNESQNIQTATYKLVSASNTVRTSSVAKLETIQNIPLSLKCRESGSNNQGSNSPPVVPCSISPSYIVNNLASNCLYKYSSPSVLRLTTCHSSSAQDHSTHNTSSTMPPVPAPIPRSTTITALSKSSRHIPDPMQPQDVPLDLSCRRFREEERSGSKEDIHLQEKQTEGQADETPISLANEDTKISEAQGSKERVLFHKPTPLNGKDFYREDKIYIPSKVDSRRERNKQTECDDIKTCSSEESATENASRTVSTKATIHCEYVRETLPSMDDFFTKNNPDDSRERQSLSRKIDKRDSEDENISWEDAARESEDDGNHPDSSSSVEEIGHGGPGNRVRLTDLDFEELSQNNSLKRWIIRRRFPSSLFSLARGHGIGFLQRHGRHREISIEGTSSEALRKVSKARSIWRKMAKSGIMYHGYPRREPRQRALLTLNQSCEAKHTDFSSDDDSSGEQKRFREENKFRDTNRTHRPLQGSRARLKHLTIASTSDSSLTSSDCEILPETPPAERGRVSNAIKMISATNDLSQLPDPLHLREQLYGIGERTLTAEPDLLMEEKHELPGTVKGGESNDKLVPQATGCGKFDVKIESGTEGQLDEDRNRFIPVKTYSSRDVVQGGKESTSKIVGETDDHQAYGKLASDNHNAGSSPKITSLMQCKIENPDSRDAWPTSEVSSPAGKTEWKKNPTSSERKLDIAEWIMIPRRALKKAKERISQQLSEEHMTSQNEEKTTADHAKTEIESDDDLPPVTWLNISRNSNGVTKE